MTNPYYNSSFVAVPISVIRSQGALAQFAAIATGFDAVKAALDLKAPSSGAALVNPTATGTADFSGCTNFYAPTPAVGDNSNRVSTTAWALAVLGASGSLIPPQAGHAGKVLQTDGTSYSWQLRLPTQAGQAGKGLKSNGTTDSWQVFNPLTGGGIQSFAAGGQITGYYRMADITVATAGTVVQLPDATTLQQGDSVLVSFNQAAATGQQGIADGSGDIVHSLGSSKVVGMLLMDNSTVAGTWKVWQPNLGSSPQSTSFASVNGIETALRTLRSGPSASVAMGGDKFLLSVPKGAGNGIEIMVVSVSGQAASIGTVATVGTDSVVWSRMFALASGYALLYMTSAGAIKVIGITVSGTTPTCGAATAVVSSVTSIDGYLTLSADAVGDNIYVGYTTASAMEVRAITMTGTSANPGGTPGTLVSTAVPFALQIVAVSSTAFLACYSTDNGSGTRTCKGVMVTVSGVSCTPNTAADIAVGSGNSADMAALLIDSTRVLFAHFDDSTTSVRARVLSITSTTVAANADVTTGSFAFTSRAGSLTNRMRISLAAVNGYYVVLAAQSTVGYALRALSVTSTTVATLGSEVSAGAIAGRNYSYVVSAVGARAFFSQQNTNGYTLYDVTSGGLGATTFGVTPASTQTYDGTNASPYSGALPMVYKLAAGKYWLAMSIDTSNVYTCVTRYGSIPA